MVKNNPLFRRSAAVRDIHERADGAAQCRRNSKHRQKKVLSVRNFSARFGPIFTRSLWHIHILLHVLRKLDEWLGGTAQIRGQTILQRLVALNVPTETIQHMEQHSAQFSLRLHLQRLLFDRNETERVCFQNGRNCRIGGYTRTYADCLLQSVHPDIFHFVLVFDTSIRVDRRGTPLVYERVISVRLRIYHKSCNDHLHS